MISHTGTIISMELGSIYSRSIKQNLNTKSSTEAELVGTNDGTGKILWTTYFLKGQGYNTKETKLYQDN